MKAFEFPAKITSEGYLHCPQDLLENLPTHQLVRVIVLVDESIATSDEKNKDWSHLAAEQFFKDENEEDAIYDTL